MIAKVSDTLPILIVGGGPVGLFLSHALSQLRGECSASERQQEDDMPPQERQRRSKP